MKVDEKQRSIKRIFFFSTRKSKNARNCYFLQCSDVSVIAMKQACRDTREKRSCAIWKQRLASSKRKREQKKRKKNAQSDETRDVTREAIHSHLEVLITLRYLYVRSWVDGKKNRQEPPRAPVSTSQFFFHSHLKPFLLTHSLFFFFLLLLLLPSIR